MLSTTVCTSPASRLPEALYIDKGKQFLDLRANPRGLPERSSGGAFRSNHHGNLCAGQLRFFSRMYSWPQRGWVGFAPSLFYNTDQHEQEYPMEKGKQGNKVKFYFLRFVPEYLHSAPSSDRAKKCEKQQQVLRCSPDIFLCLDLVAGKIKEH